MNRTHGVIPKIDADDLVAGHRLPVDLERLLVPLHAKLGHDHLVVQYSTLRRFCNSQPLRNLRKVCP
jgi:hypothetical protein